MSGPAIFKPPVLLMVTGTSAVSVGKGPGWVSGDIASLGISASVNSVFDLGPDWDQYSLLTMVVTGVNPITSVTPYASDDGATNAQPLLTANGLSAAFVALAAAGAAVLACLPAGRYIRISTVNGASAQDASASIRLVAYSG